MSAAVLDALRTATAPTGGAAAGEAHPATDADAVAGVPARYVAAPASTGQAAAVLRVAAEHGLAVVVRGAGTRQDWAAPPRRLDLVLETRLLTGVVEHAAGDLIAVVRAGTPVDEFAKVLATAGQQLALDAPLAGATVGGTVAVNAAGPRRMIYGTVRDLLIGVTVVRPDGVVAKAGGRVVKNVAGYDLGKLFAGSFGTLGLIAECVFRLHPLPAATAAVVATAEHPAGAGRLVGAVLGAQVAPSAVELDAAPDRPVEVAVLLEGVPAGVAARSATLTRLLGPTATVSAEPPPWWSTYPWRPGGTGIKLTSAISRAPALLATVLDCRRRYRVELTARGCAGTGVFHVGLAAGAEPTTVARIVEELRGAAHAAAGHAVVLTAPDPVRDLVDLWGPVNGIELMRRVKREFDPDARFAPGRFVGGI